MRSPELLTPRLHTGWGLVLILSLAAFPVASAEPSEDDPSDQAGALEEGDDPELGDDLGAEFDLLEEEAVIFSAAKHEQTISDSPSTITVVTREEVANTHCLSVACLLRQVPEIEVRQLRSGNHAVGARALVTELNDKVQLLIDGREFNAEAFGMPMWQSLPIHLEDIERIEIVRGPGSALYGANAHSLVVSITTRREDGGAEVFVASGEHERTSAHMRAGTRLGSWRLNISAGLEEGANRLLPDLSDLQMQRIRAMAEVESSLGTSGLQIGVVHHEGDFYTNLAPMVLHNTWLASAMLNHKADWWKAHVWFGVDKTDLEIMLPLEVRLSGLGSYVKLGTMPDRVDVLSTTLDAEYQADFQPWTGNHLLGGANYRWLTYLSDDNDPSTVNQHRVGVFLQDEQRLWDQLLLTLGVRLDYNSITPLTFSPRAAVVWRFVPSQALRLSFGQAFRKPSFLNTSFHVVGVEGSVLTPSFGDFIQRSIGNENLDNERITAFELGYRGRFLNGAITLEGDGFFNMYRDIIEIEYLVQFDAFGLPDLEDSRLRFRNTGAGINTAGGSLAVTWRYRKMLRVQANYTYRYSWYVTEPLTSAVSGRKAGDRMEWEPAHLANAAVHYLAPFGLRVGISAHARSSFDKAWTVDGSLLGTQTMVHNPANLFFSGYLSYRMEQDDRWLEAGVRALDIFDHRFRDGTSVIRFDGVDMGSQVMSRRVVLFLRGGI